MINSLAHGGAERQLSILVPELAQAGVDQEVISLVDRGNHMAVPPEMMAPARRGFLGVLSAMSSAIRSGKKPDTIIVAWMYHSWIVGLLAHLVSLRRTPLFLYCRHGDPATLKAGTKLVCWCLLRLASILAIPVVFNSAKAESLHRGRFPAHVIPNAVASVHRLKSDRTLKIGFLGRNHADKGADLVGVVFAEILGQLPAWRASIAGPGMRARTDEIYAEIRAAGVSTRRVEISDVVDDVSSFLLGVDVLVMPSRTESFPNVLTEAMALGVPVVAMDVGEVGGILGEVLPVARSIPELVAMAVETCNMNEPSVNRLREKLHATAHERYDASAVALQHMTLWFGEEMGQ